MTNESDRELLELAAKAVGWWDKGFDCYKGPAQWDPLSDPSDALWLLQVLGNKYGTQVTIGSGTNIEIFAVDDCDTFEPGDELAATMRAITRAAAEIGRGRE